VNERDRRIGVNEALFREVNEQIEALNRRLPGEAGTMHVVCECGNASCVDRFEVEIAEYERARKDPRRFLVAPGHEIPDVEIVIDRHEAYYVIEKNAPEAERVAEATDPRG
jgi:tRNA pseudouridine-54 N-methylase